MANIFSSARCRYLPFLHPRFFSKEIKGSFNKAPKCKEHKKPKEQKCHPKPPSCYATTINACPFKEWPDCSEPLAKPAPHLACCCDNRLTKDSCEKQEKKHKSQEIKPFKSMWEVCGVERQCIKLERLDIEHYKESNKANRVYTQTWKNCVPITRNRKVCCINEMCMVPPLNKRPKQKSPPTAKEKDNELLKVNYNILKKCLEKPPENPNTRRINKCPKVVMPCCRKVAASVICRRIRSHSKCLKERCPHPSFSEYDHPCGKRQPPVECRCNQFASLCDACRYFIWKKIFRVEPPLPAWPPVDRPK